MEVATVLTLVEWAIEEEPQVATALRNIFSKPDPTAADWQAERAAAKASYRDLVPNSQLPPDPPPAGA